MFRQHEFIYAEANVGSRSCYIDLDRPDGRRDLAQLLCRADVVVNNHRSGSLGSRGLDPHELAEERPGLIYVSVTCYGSEGPWAGRGGFDMNGSAASGLMVVARTPEAREGLVAQLAARSVERAYLAVVHGELEADEGTVDAPLGRSQSHRVKMVKRSVEGGSWHVQVNLARSAMWCSSLGTVDPAQAGSTDEHRLLEPVAYDAPSPLGEVHTVAPPVEFSHTRPAWPDPILVPRGSGRPEWSR